MKLLISVLLAVSVCGCATVRKALYTEKPVQVSPASTNSVVTAVTNAVPTITTNTLTSGDVIVTRGTNYQVALTTNYVVLPAVWTTNLVGKPEVETATTAAGSAPVPGAPIAASIASLAIAAYASWVNRRNQATAAKVAGTLVDNFERLRQVAMSIPGYTPAVDDALMVQVKDSQAAAGVKSIINEIVDNRTEATTPKPIP
jgi:hypothetical protein